MNPTWNENWMRFAIRTALLGQEQGEAPFGCVIVSIQTNHVLASAFGSETPDDCTRHSECVAIREAMGRTRLLLNGYALFSTHEPCAMCCGAINHSKLSMVVWGSSRVDLPERFRQRRISAHQLLHDTSRPATVISGVLRKECIELFQGRDSRESAA